MLMIYLFCFETINHRKRWKCYQQSEGCKRNFLFYPNWIYIFNVISVRDVREWENFYWFELNPLRSGEWICMYLLAFVWITSCNDELKQKREIEFFFSMILFLLFLCWLMTSPLTKKFNSLFFYLKRNKNYFLISTTTQINQIESLR